MRFDERFSCGMCGHFRVDHRWERGKCDIHGCSCTCYLGADQRQTQEMGYNLINTYWRNKSEQQRV